MWFRRNPAPTPPWKPNWTPVRVSRGAVLGEREDGSRFCALCPFACSYCCEPCEFADLPFDRPETTETP